MRMQEALGSFQTEAAKPKYTNDAWNRKTTVKTYSKSRPCQIKSSSSKKFDEIFSNPGPKPVDIKEETDSNMSKETQVKDTLNTEKSFAVISSVTAEENAPLAKENGISDYANDSCGSQSNNPSPKNSTCIEGGAKIKNSHMKEPPLSPIQDLRNEKTNMNTVSMEFTNPCIPETRLNSSCCLSTIGGSTPYILAALRVKKVRRSRKASVAPFVKQTLKNLRQQRLLKKSTSSTKYLQTSENESSKENHFPKTSTSFPNHDCIPQKQTNEGEENDEIRDQETTPEDRNASLRLKMDQASLKSRRSLNYVKKNNIPLDLLLTAPLNLDFKKAKVRIKRNPNWFTNVTDRKRYTTDILLREKQI